MKNRLLQGSFIAFLLMISLIKGTGDRHQVAYSPTFPESPPFLGVDPFWVDSLMEELSLEDKIAQMILVQAYSNMGEVHEKSIYRTISRHHIGGVAFFQGDPVQQARLTNLFQEGSRIPLLVAMDAENGLGFRLKNTISYPPQMVLGAITDNSLIHQLGRDMARQMKRLGVQMNFAPVADINNNPENRVIHTRSFGEDRENVSKKVVALMRGMQEEGILVAAKHFPGHGDTDADSHHSLPVVAFDRHRLDSVELYPFREAILRGLSCIMVAHLQVPALDSSANRPATVSEKVITRVLKEEMGFKGLVITDALNMKGLSEHFSPGSREVEAVRAGNDLLLMPSDVGLAIDYVKRAVKTGEIPEQRINESCRKILLAKYWSGLANFTPIDTASLLEELNHPLYLKNRRELIARSITLVRNRDSLLPLRDLQKLKLATVTISQKGEYHPGAISDLYIRGDHFTLTAAPDPVQSEALMAELEKYNTVIINILGTSAYVSRGLGISEGMVQFIGQLAPGANMILNLASAPNALDRFENLDRFKAVILSFEGDPVYQEYTLQAIFGGRSFSGRLPASGGVGFPCGAGMSTGPPVRLGYADPLDAGMDPDRLREVDSIIGEAIRLNAMPGCQLFVARKGLVVWHKAYGHHTYQRKRPVALTDLYDLASLTKITATVPALMRMRDRGIFSENDLLGSYHVVPDSCNKAGLLVADILSHQAGLVPWIPFHHLTLEPLDTSQELVSRNWSYQYPLKIGPSDYANRNVKYTDSTYEQSYSPDYPVQVADHLYLRAGFRDTIYRHICDSELLEPEYRYSDLGYYLFQKVIEQETDTMLYPYVWYNFFAPIGAESLCFLPLNRFPRERIVPTENDIFFRRQLLQGHVHDVGSAMLGGIAGHAGLFGTANDVGKMMQMFLNGGWYGEDRFIGQTTLATFTSCYDCENGNRRGLGFDRPLTEDPEAGPACRDASPMSFGHSGYTGTLAWVDPFYGLVFVFLSNRIHPDQANALMIDENIRTRIQQAVYDSLLD